ncbi:hypothetical protein M408DRAFT_328318 [Serendipita vermifera MAFF 305830]|uniref:Uncharacterized protein n=1 Tax=Serendipita vermifera MAFF 305830 TaxID=933852 RepID=A0A0C3B0J0_SERVB|nr:hypothetical protein M408DRAFT_328318 [Serendipita vermifera MAFF 305830]
MSPSFTVVSDSYPPHVVRDSAGLAVPGPTFFFPYVPCHDVAIDGDGLYSCQECLALYHDFVRTDPEMAISLEDLRTNGMDVIGHPSSVEATLPAIDMSTDTSPLTNEDRQSESLVEETSPSTNSTSPTPIISGSHAHRRYNYQCVVCGQLHDRAERARDCANRDEGLKPHAFSGGPSVDKWGSPKSYSLEALLREHLAAPQDRDIQCPKWLVFVMYTGVDLVFLFEINLARESLGGRT